MAPATPTALREATRYESELTPRQKEVLALVAAGLTNHEIGVHLGISLDGAKWHVSEILSKLALSSREEAAAYWQYRNSFPVRLRRAWAGVLGMPAMKWAAGATAAGLVGGVATLAVVFALGGDEDSTPPLSPGDATAQPTPEADCPVDDSACAFAREFDGWLERGDSPSAVAASLPVTYECFGPDAVGAGQNLPACDGVRAGETRDGYYVGIAPSDQIEVFPQEEWEVALDAFMAGIPPAQVSVQDSPRVVGLVCPPPANDCSGGFVLVTNLTQSGTGPTGQPLSQGTAVFAVRSGEQVGVTGILYNGVLFESTDPDGDGSTTLPILFPGADAPVTGIYRPLTGAS